MSDPLTLKVEQFKHDVDIVHLITHGDDALIVQTEGGPIRSLAKLIKDAGLELQTYNFSLYTSKPLLITGGRFTTEHKVKGSLFMNMAMVFLDLTPDDFTSSGQLKYDRDYLVEEHIGVSMANNSYTAIIPGDVSELNGKYAQVSYLSWQN